jgi:hypothetical protein
MNKRYPCIAFVMLVLAALACNRTAPTPTPQVETPIPTLPSAGDGTPIPSATPLPSATLLPGVTPSPSPLPATPTQGTPECVYDADFVTDVTIPDDTELDPGAAFVKTWRMHNSGTCAWEAGTAWGFESGDKMGGADAVSVSVVEPGDTIDVSVNLTAPDTPGTYTGYWKMRRPNGAFFGTRSFVRIVVLGEATATPTTTRVPTAEPGTGPTINYFRADVDEADPGDTITLEWETENVSSVILYHLQPTGELGDSWEGLDTSGTFDYEIQPEERNHTGFVLFAYDDEGHIAQETLFVSLRCPDTWFFTPAPNSCPSGPAVTFTAAEEHFEHGTMIWLDEQDVIYVLFDDGSSPHWSVFSDEWEDGDPQDDPSLTPPAGLYQPVRGFGLIWREQTGVRDRLGWATDAEAGFSTSVQRTSRPKYNDVYIQALDGGVWELLSGSSGWEKLP